MLLIVAILLVSVLVVAGISAVTVAQPRLVP
jgi:hypothetical protein